MTNLLTRHSQDSLTVLSGLLATSGPLWLHRAISPLLLIRIGGSRESSDSRARNTGCTTRQNEPGSCTPKPAEHHLPMTAQLTSQRRKRRSEPKPEPELGTRKKARSLQSPGNLPRELVLVAVIMCIPSAPFTSSLVTDRNLALRHAMAASLFVLHSMTSLAAPLPAKLEHRLRTSFVRSFCRRWRLPRLRLLTLNIHNRSRLTKAYVPSCLQLLFLGSCIAQPSPSIYVLLRSCATFWFAQDVVSSAASHWIRQNVWL